MTGAPFGQSIGDILFELLRDTERESHRRISSFFRGKNRRPVRIAPETKIDCPIVVIAHADWSAHPEKRWMAVACRKEVRGDPAGAGEAAHAGEAARAGGPVTRRCIAAPADPGCASDALTASPPGPADSPEHLNSAPPEPGDTPEQLTTSPPEPGDTPEHLTASPPEEVGPPGTLLERLAARGEGPLVIGFDFPLGVPLAYAERAGVKSFRELLARAGKGEFARFFDPAETPDEISIGRPFYPRRPGGTRRQHLVDALGLTGFHELYRRCDRTTSGRSAAAALFWTLGGQQVGRAAISGWRDVLQPALADPETDIAMWPFEGDFDTMITDHRIVAAETYPREAALRIGLGFPGGGWSKRSQRDRASRAPQILRYAGQVGLTLDPALCRQLEDGFGAGASGEDRFDATLGVLLMTGVLSGRCPPGTPPPGDVRSIEGWILGQTHKPTGEHR